MVFSWLFALAVAYSAAANPARGKEAFDKRCAGCHGLDQAREGPPLRGIFARRAAATPGFPYSDALAKSRLAWDQASLDKWLEDPEKLVPGNDMSTRVPDADIRTDLISYLKTLNETR